MQAPSKIEAVIVNGKPVAVRISFKHNAKHYARQYAITDDLTYDQAVVLCNKYKDRIIIRSMDQAEKDKIMQTTDEDMKKLVMLQQASERRLQAVRMEVQLVLIRYAPHDDGFAYLNVYGMPVKKNPVSWG